MESICMAKELSLYNLEGKWNDYIGVQKEVIRVLREIGFFSEKEVCNRETGISILINAKGIKETLGAGLRFQALPKKLKQYKVTTLRYLKRIIENAELIADEVDNFHEENGFLFAYFKSEILIDGKKILIRIAVKKRVSSNWFWIHHVDENEKSSKLLDPARKTELKEI